MALVRTMLHHGRVGHCLSRQTAKQYFLNAHFAESDVVIICYRGKVEGGETSGDLPTLHFSGFSLKMELPSVNIETDEQRDS